MFKLLLISITIFSTLIGYSADFNLEGCFSYKSENLPEDKNFDEEFTTIRDVAPLYASEFVNAHQLDFFRVISTTSLENSLGLIGVAIGSINGEKMFVFWSETSNGAGVIEAEAARILEITEDSIAIGDDHDREDSTIYSRITRIKEQK